jgi:hypothetical protein
MTLIIPEHQKEALISLISLDARTRAALVENLRSSPPSLFIRDLARGVSEKLSLRQDDVFEMLRTLASLDALRTQHLDEDDQDPVAFAKMVTSAVEEELSATTPPDGWDAFRAFLTELFRNTGALKVTAKASEIRWESERTLCPENCRIISEIRPVFSDKASEQPAAALIVHTLKLAYHVAGSEEIKGVFLTLDLDDLLRVHELVDRAIDKDQSLRSFLKQVGLPNLEG